MHSFTEYLTEAAQGKRTHLTHLEDVILDDGPSGASYALGVLKEFGKVLNGGTVSRSLNVSVKWDGAPAIVFGPDPADGKFFVATKSAFSKSPKLAKTHADIDALYQSGVEAVLHIALDALSQLHPKTVLQADVLFTAAALGKEVINNRPCLTFQPNTILYAVDVDSELAERVKSAAIGIVIHTMYVGKGPSLADYKATAIAPAVFATLKKSKSVLALDAAYDDVSGSVTFTAEEADDFTLALERATQLTGSIDRGLYDVLTQEPLHAYLQQFLNAQVVANQQPAPQKAFEALIFFLSGLRDKTMGQRKTADGRQRIEQQFQIFIDDLLRYKQAFKQWYALYTELRLCKNMVVRKLSQASRIGTFIQTPDGLRTTNPEGFVAVSHNGKAVKLVDRLEFSRHNALSGRFRR